MIKELEKRLITSLILIPISIFFIVKGSIFFIFFLSISFLVSSYEWILMTKKKKFIQNSRYNFSFVFILFSIRI